MASADLKISQLNTASALTGAELIPLVQDGANVRATVSALTSTITSTLASTIAGTFTDGSAAYGGTYPAETVTPMRVPGMVFIGSGFDSLYLTYAPSPGEGSWIKTEVNEGLRYLEKGTQLRVGSQIGGVAGLFFTRQSDNDQLSTDPSAICSANYGHNDVTGTRSVWGTYNEVRRILDAGPAIGAEFEVVTTGDDTVALTPYGYLGGGSPRTLAYGMIIGSGGGNSSFSPSVTTYDASNAIVITNNTSRFKRGITFLYGSLTRETPGDETTPADAIVLALGHQIKGTYGVGVNSTSGIIRFDNPNAFGQQRLVFTDGALRVKGVDADLTEVDLFALGAPTLTAGQLINRISLLPLATAGGGSGNTDIQAAGGDTNIGVRITGKGTGGGQLRDGATGPRVLWDTTGVGFNGVGPIAKPTLGAALSTGGAETNTNLATRINELRSALILYGLTT